MMPQNILQVFKETVRLRGDSPCFRYKEEGRWLTLNWEEVYKKVLDLAGGLKRLGIKKGDRVCIFSHSRYEWTVADLAILSNGAITVPIYESSTSDQATYILKNCGARLVFVEDINQLNKILGVRSSLTDLRQIILFEAPPHKVSEDGVYHVDEVSLLGAGSENLLFDRMSSEIKADSDATYVYTSGTTGPPKGAILTHGNILSELNALVQVLPFSPKTESLLFLPLAHILARVLQFAQIHRGFVQCYAESIDKLMDNISELRPHLMASVPRIFEKVHTRVMQGVESGSSKKKAIFNWALDVGRRRSEYQLNGKSIPLSLRLKWLLAHRLVFTKLHQKMGGRIAFFISGGAPLSKEIAEFFHAAGFLILEGYGLTETTAAVACNSQNALRLGTVGRILPGTEVKTASDGEILVRGGVVFKGYYQRPEATEESIDKEGWFHTGDIGEIDGDGFLKITDRKKDIIVTAAGKNIAPQNIENLLKTDPIISQVMVHGDKRKYLSALITLNMEEAANYAKSHRISFKSQEELAKSEEIHQRIKDLIDRKNRELAQYETIKKFAILERDFSIETGELTPTLKVKRKFTSQKYQHILDEFYQD